MSVISIGIMFAISWLVFSTVLDTTIDASNQTLISFLNISFGETPSQTAQINVSDEKITYMENTSYLNTTQFKDDFQKWKG